MRASRGTEADADVCEAIDFLEFYARGAVALERGKPLFQVPGERNELRYVPRGVVAVIAPWNFPLAIPTGMAAAALATGNTVVLKPAEQSPACGHVVVRALREAGVPADAVALLPGAGETGAALVRHPRRGDDRVHRLRADRARHPAGRGRRPARRSPAQAGRGRDGRQELRRRRQRRRPRRRGPGDRGLGVRLRRPEVLGRRPRPRPRGGRTTRCSSAWPAPSRSSRWARRRPSARTSRPSSSARPRSASSATAPWPATPGASWPSTRAACPRPAGSCRRRSPPTCPPDSPVLAEEVFGPLLAVERVRDVDDACDRIDELPFALTGGLFSRNPHTVDYVVRRTPVGNLYVNREITGAMVGRQPFGGNRLSGHRDEGRRPGLPPALRGAEGRDGEHRPPRPRDLIRGRLAAPPVVAGRGPCWRTCPLRRATPGTTIRARRSSRVAWSGVCLRPHSARGQALHRRADALGP